VTDTIPGIIVGTLLVLFGAGLIHFHRTSWFHRKHDADLSEDDLKILLETISQADANLKPVGCDWFFNRDRRFPLYALEIESGVIRNLLGRHSIDCVLDHPECAW